MRDVAHPNDPEERRDHLAAHVLTLSQGERLVLLQRINAALRRIDAAHGFVPLIKKHAHLARG